MRRNKFTALFENKWSVGRGSQPVEVLKKDLLCGMNEWLLVWGAVGESTQSREKHANKTLLGRT